MNEPQNDLSLSEIGRRLERLEHHAQQSDARFLQLEGRIAKIESDLAVIKSNYVTREELKDTEARILQAMRASERRVYAVMFGLALSGLGVMAKGFGWL